MSQDHHINEYLDIVSVQKAEEKLQSRLNKLESHFKAHFHQNPSFCVRVPGRVNLIGEHVDYSGYSVCPMAIEQDILVACCESFDEDILSLTNLDDKYKNYTGDMRSAMDVNKIRDCDGHGKGPMWYEYFYCGIKGALEVIPKSRAVKGMRVAVWGNIPPNAGLSSSSALVSAALLTTMHASQHKMSKKDMATISASAERYIGTQGGGMDQAIAFLAKAGSAKHIEFNPLRGYDVILPNDAVFVIAHSLVDHNKAATSDFNQRVVECKLASRVIAKKRSLDWLRIHKLMDLQTSLNKSIKEMLDIVEMDLHDEPYTLEEVNQILENESEYASCSYVKLKLKQRALHVFQEADRVYAFKKACEEEQLDSSKKLIELGKFMKASHNSLRVLYECSHPRIDSLVQAANHCGALGARLTGAGWGGCIVALTTRDKVDSFIENLTKSFFKKDANYKNFDISKLMFPTEPNQGAAVYNFQ